MSSRTLAPCRPVVLALLLLLPALAAAQELSAQKTQTPAPAEVAEPIRALLAPEATVVKRGANTLEFWWVQALPAQSAPSGSPEWKDVAAGALVGAVRIAQPLADIRGLPVKPGVYTLRYAQRPEDGDHTGVSPFRQFLLLSPAADDQATEPAGYKGAVSLSKKTLGKSHPASLSIDPPTTTEPAGGVTTNEAGHKGVVFGVPVTHGGNPAGTLGFGLVLVGTYEH